MLIEIYDYLKVVKLLNVKIVGCYFDELVQCMKNVSLDIKGSEIWRKIRRVSSVVKRLNRKIDTGTSNHNILTDDPLVLRVY